MASSPVPPDAERLAAILRSIPEFVVVVGPDRRIRYLNRAEPGYEPEELVGLQVDEALPPESRKVFYSALEALKETGEPQEYDAEFTLADGFHAWYRSRMLPFGEDEGGTSVLLIATNITELREAQSEVARLRRLLPICSWCDKIQNEEGEWDTIERYLAEERDTRVSHGLCPDCYERQLKGLDEEDGSNGSAA